MKKEGVKSFTVINALNSLINKGYIRRGVMDSTRTYYVMLRGI
jgi:hypothetical protein